MKSDFGRRQTWIAVVLIVFGSLGIALYVQDTVRSVARDLPVTLLDQERDAETLTREISHLAWAIEIWRRDPTAVNRERVAIYLGAARQRADMLRANYNLDNMVGAAGMYAVANPVIQDLQAWFERGVPGQPPGSAAAMALMQSRARDAEKQLVRLLAESRDAARSMLLLQEGRLDRFARGVGMLTAFAAALVLGLVLLLFRQRRLLDLKEQAETAALSAQRAAEEASRAKSEFLANMSHELRTPLNAINGFSAIIRDEMLGPISPARYREYAADILSSGEHLLAIIGDILDLSKVEAGKFELSEEEFDAGEIMDAALLLVREKTAQGRIVLEMLPPVRPVTLHADRRALLQVLINLLTNAVKFTPSGRIVLSAGLAEDGGFVYVVADSGIGMTTAQIRLALQPFGQVQNALTRMQSGTGLGLPLSERLVALHDGWLQIDSAPGEGTRVTVCLPRSRVVTGGQQSAMLPRSTEASVQPSSAQPPRAARAEGSSS